MSIDFSNDPHRRLNILTGEWVLVSPHRTKRPWQGKVEQLPSDQRPDYDPTCYLCPGNERAGGAQNPEYTSTYVFKNDFAALLDDSTEATFDQGLMKAKGETGLCKVICFSPNHSLTIPEMGTEELGQVVATWIKEYQILGAMDHINHIQIFENKGAMMGCSNPHPHGQIWSQSSIPEVTAKKTSNQAKYYTQHGRSMLGDYLEQELESGERKVCENEHFLALVPFWAIWPYETMILPKRHMQHIAQMNDQEKKAFASILKELTIRMDNIFNCSFPYSSGIHQAPTDGQSHEAWHWHMSFYPPLLRSATVKKFMVGYEMFANPQRDISAEQAAQQLRNVSNVHYKVRH